MLAKRDNVMDTVLQFDDLTISEGHGRRAERVHYFSNHGLCRGVTTAPTWDTLLYLGSTRRLTFHFVSGHVVIEQYNFTEIEHNRCEQRYPFGISRMDLRILRSSGDHSGSSVDILYSTYLGGSRTDAVSIIRQVGEHRFILVGTTDSQDFPIVGNPFSSTLKGDPASMYSRDVHITCLDVQRNEILFSSYFGGWDLESLVAVEIDASGNIVFAGSTWSDDLPTTENAWQRQYAGHGDGYIAALNDTGSELVFCSYIGGAGVENLKAMKMDEHGDIVIS